MGEEAVRKLSSSASCVFVRTRLQALAKVYQGAAGYDIEAEWPLNPSCYLVFLLCHALDAESVAAESTNPGFVQPSLALILVAR